MNPWRPFPLVRLLMPFLTGILMGIWLIDYLFIPTWITLCLLAIVLLLNYLPPAHNQFQFRGAFGLVVFITLTVVGFQLVSCHHAPKQPGYIGKNPDGLFLVVVKEPPVVKGAYCKAVLEVDAQFDSEGWQSASGRIMASCRVKDVNTIMQYGDALLIKGILTPIVSNANPHAFDYASFLKSKGITHQVILASHQWYIVAAPELYQIQRFAFVLRDRLLQVFRELNISGREFGVASALLLGYTNGIDPELRREYAATGAMHILSVSGMHVGIIYLFLESLLGFMGKRRRTRLLKTILLISFIWFYALLTGLSPSVIRASTMLSFIIFGRSLDRLPDIYNILSASLMLILSTNPYLIIDVGFQLSYLAVLGIVIFYKPIYDLVLTPIWIIDKIWSIVACSLAATISTMPLTLFTFHQFPNYFILTNIAVVPLSSVIIYTGILTLAVGPIALLSQWIGTLFEWMVWLLNFIIHNIDVLPHSTTMGIYITPIQMLLLYLVIALVYLFLIRKRLLYLWLLLSTLIVLESTFLVDKVTRLSQFSLIVYNFPGCLAIDLLDQDKASLYYWVKGGEEGLSAYASEVVRNVGYARGAKYRNVLSPDGRTDLMPQVTIADVLPPDRGTSFIQFKEIRMAILRHAVSPRMTTKIDMDYLIISGNPFLQLGDVCRVFHPEQIIIDATNDGWRVRKWLTEAKVLGIPCHAVAINGAFVKDF